MPNATATTPNCNPKENCVNISNGGSSMTLALRFCELVGASPMPLTLENRFKILEFGTTIAHVGVDLLRICHYC